MEVTGSKAKSTTISRTTYEADIKRPTSAFGIDTIRSGDSVNPLNHSIAHISSQGSGTKARSSGIYQVTFDGKITPSKQSTFSFVSMDPTRNNAINSPVYRELSISGYSDVVGHDPKNPATNKPTNMGTETLDPNSNVARNVLTQSYGANKKEAVSSFVQSTPANRQSSSLLRSGIDDASFSGA